MRLSLKITRTRTVEDTIDDKIFKMIDHLDRALAAGAITALEYHRAMVDLGRYAHARRAENARQ